jgi:hypothetical protein
MTGTFFNAHGMDKTCANHQEPLGAFTLWSKVPSLIDDFNPRADLSSDILLFAQQLGKLAPSKLD